MPLPAEQYAFLSSAIYDPLTVNTEIRSDTHQYVVRYVSPLSATNYRGAVFEDRETGELIVANKGTDPSNIHDIVADYGMGIMGAPTQWPEAAATMRAALNYAKNYDIPLSQVSTTGHSLGGAEAQLQAAMFGIYAETFNAYGAAAMARQLGMDVQAAQEHVVNHRMHHDPVSALAAPIGRTVAYMDYADYQRHERGGLALAGELGAVVSAHGMDNFWDKLNNRPAPVFAHNYLHDLQHRRLDDMAPGMPMDMPWHTLHPHASHNPQQRQLLPANASDEQIFEHLVAAMETGDDQQFRQALKDVGHTNSYQQFHAQAAEQLDMQDRLAALENQLQQAQEQLMAQQQTRSHAKVMSL
jgi:hypothetical protein